MTLEERRKCTIGEIHEALAHLKVKTNFEPLFFSNNNVSVRFPDEGNIRFGIWDCKKKRFSQIHEKYKSLYKTTPEVFQCLLEPLPEGVDVYKVQEANELLGELIPKLVKLGLMLCELQKGEGR